MRRYRKTRCTRSGEKRDTHTPSQRRAAPFALTQPAILISRWLGWRGFANLQSAPVRERYAAELAAAGLSVADLHAAWRIARRHARQSPIGLLAHWVRHGLVRSVLDEARVRAKAANRTRPAFEPIAALTAITARLAGAVRLVDDRPPPFDRRALAAQMAGHGPGSGRERVVAS
jgi:hypothetical protein